MEEEVSISQISIFMHTRYSFYWPICNPMQVSVPGGHCGLICVPMTVVSTGAL